MLLTGQWSQPRTSPPSLSSGIMLKTGSIKYVIQWVHYRVEEPDTIHYSGEIHAANCVNLFIILLFQTESVFVLFLNSFKHMFWIHEKQRMRGQQPSGVHQSYRARNIKHFLEFVVTVPGTLAGAELGLSAGQKTFVVQQSLTSYTVEISGAIFNNMFIIQSDIRI
jgi:hypothetical protein